MGYGHGYRVGRRRQHTNTSAQLRAMLFAAGEQGVWYDPSDLSTMFQDSAGVTPVTAAGQSVGLVLDKSKGLVLGPELVTNGGFSNGTTGWTGSNSTIAVVGGELQITADGAGQARATQTVTTVAGRWYEARATLRRGTGVVSVDLLIAGVASSAAVTSTTPTQVVVRFAATAASTTIRPGSSGAAVAGTTYFCDNISVKELPGNHATQANAASRPVLRQTGGGLYYLEFDGTDDFLVTNTITPGIDKVQVFAGVRKLSDAAAGFVAETSVNASANNGAFYFSAPNSAGPNYVFVSKGSAAQVAAVYSNAAVAAPVTNVATGISDIAGDNAVLRINGTQVATSAADQGTGNFLAYPLYIGRRGGTTLPFNGQIYGLIVRFGANLTADQIASTERFVAAKTGVTI